MSESALWVIFIIIFVTVMAVDLFAVDSKETQINTKKAGRLTLIYITIALLFGVLIYFELGSESAASYYAAYAIELSMSVDNLFVFMVIFAAFAIPFQDQHRVLFYGILGAIFLRLLFVEVGADLLETFDWMMYIFGAILIYTAVKTAFSKSEGKKTEDTLSYKLSKKINSTPDLRGAKFLVRENGKMLATPLLLCLIVIELSDIMFAFDSIPAALAISTDIFLVYTSNIFAVMGLRSMYFVIRDVLGNLRFLKYGLGVILMFIGLKMLLSAADICEVSTFASLAVIIIVLAVTVVASLASKNSSP
ncbi:MAG: TerC/Alx family metal homeostasis membrane protein [Candidatus Methanomethylophilus sp.]|jgi:tellurite resistance protein TerC|nr:TerC/Alx family metal homeostasis membrane protein [Methanomethylophilus sp.]MCI2075112.1 TerC/Alx family metal homeostasis membrane protein [Methanomethylophilus sp.]MCI2092454.1 TerC/Alx family metal homeostasis membrane protein [Methanomethylophilus sp.]